MTYRYPGGLVRRTAANTAITGASGVWDLGSQAQAVRNNTWPISGLANPISGSLRFRSSASAYLNRTPASAGNRRTWTWSAWVKLGTIAASNGTLFSAGTTSGGSTRFYLRYTGSQFQTGFGSFNLDTTVAVFRDPSAWYHIVIAIDTTQATASNRVKIYVNGVQQAVTTDANYTLNADTAVNNTVSHQIASDQIIPGGYFDGYMTEVYLIDGQALTPASFGQTSAITGVWEPIKYTGTYGTNGFYLSLSDTSSIGKDFSGRGNNWSPNNFSTASGSTFDLMRDVPTQYTPQGATDIGGTVRGNYATLNPLWTRYDTNGTFSRGNLQYTGTGSAGDATFTFVESTIAIPENSTGKWYWETQISATTGRAAPGIVGSNFPGGQYGSFSSALTGNYAGAGAQNGVFYKDGSSVLSGQTGGGTANDYAMFAYDASSGKLWYGVNGTWWNSGAPASGTGQVTTLSTSLSWFPSAWVQSSSDSIIFNFGQRPFAYTPPSGFKSLCTTNLPTSTIGATTTTAAGKYFNTVIWTGTGGTRSITGVGFQPDFVWAKARSQAYSNILFDSNRGVGKNLLTDTTYAEATNEANGYISSFDADGFSSNFSAAANYYFNESSTTYVAWNWNAGGSTVTNTSGTISSQVRANPTAGFSIATYTGNGTSGATVGHGLGVAPSMYIVKVRSTTESWITYHTSIGATNYLALNLTQASSAATGAWNNTAPTSTVFSLGNASSTNGSGSTFVAYCFAQVAGYSAFGSYTGNGSSDGPFIYTGFKPRFVIIKRTDAVQQWWITDTARNPSNTCNLDLFANLANAEENNGYNLDLLSNGVKIRTSTNDRNASSGTYIYMAFAEHPFKNACLLYTSPSPRD